MKSVNHLEVICNKISHVCKRYNCLDDMGLDYTSCEYFDDPVFQPTRVFVQLLHEMTPAEKVVFDRVNKWLKKYNRRHGTNYTIEVEF